MTVNTTRSFVTYRDEVKIGSQHTFKLIQAEQDYFGDSALRYSLPNVLVIQDDAYQQVEGFTYSVAYLQTDKVQTECLTQLLDEELPIEWKHPLTYEFSDDQKSVRFYPETARDSTSENNQMTAYRLTLANRFTTMRGVRRQAGIVLFVSLFVGVIVLITTSSSLIVRQFSNTEREKHNYRLLTKLGYTRKEVRKLVYWQNIWIFMPGTLLAILHAVFAINTFTQIIDSPGYWVAHLFAAVAAVVYLFAYLITVKLCLRIIET